MEAKDHGTDSILIRIDNDEQDSNDLGETASAFFYDQLEAGQLKVKEILEELERIADGHSELEEIDGFVFSRRILCCIFLLEINYIHFSFLQSGSRPNNLARPPSLPVPEYFSGSRLGNGTVSPAQVHS